MLRADLENKLTQSELISEDFLTSSVFSVFRFVNSRWLNKYINQAIEILRKTYTEITKMKTEFAQLLCGTYSDIPPMVLAYEYSAGGRFLTLRHNHSYLFEGMSESEGFNGKRQILAILCVFSDEWNLDRVSLKDQPELWVALIDIVTKEDKWSRPAGKDLLDDIHENFRKPNRERFRIDFEIGGEVCKNEWKKNDKNNVEESWTTKFIGYPLVKVKDKKFIEEEILDKLLERKMNAGH